MWKECWTTGADAISIEDGDVKDETVHGARASKKVTSLSSFAAVHPLWSINVTTMSISCSIDIRRFQGMTYDGFLSHIFKENERLQEHRSRKEIDSISTKEMQVAVLVSLCLFVLACNGVTWKYDEDLARRFVVYSSIAYCSDDSIKSWTCNACYGDLYFQKSSVVFDSETNTFGYIGTTRIETNPPTHAIVIAFRGTNPSSLKNLEDDLNVMRESFDSVPGASVHIGFMKAWTNLKTQMVPELQKLLQWYKEENTGCDSSWPTYPHIYFTGHSLGAALTTVALADLVSTNIINSNDYPIHLYTFGSPRCGNEAFSQYINKNTVESWRVIHWDDPIPRVPPLLSGYHHVSSAVFYNEDNSNHIICEGESESSNCNPWTIDFNIYDHRHYLGINVIDPGSAKIPHVCPATSGIRGRWKMWMITPIVGGVTVIGAAIAAVVYVMRRKRKGYINVN
ncbi:hypothetical protein PROFUN_04508 [Planoprotostelium fungivorum]|uniref:Fungal lipase-type domain-containing protein n=1 Tax=Planoprotostelium fungivorum TaxID=1890364 RepID=A0A2P6NBF8_9EUKA|nr:hypothetical protein PROFUN_04508 [Planoprotostelium fungivorum]